MRGPAPPLLLAAEYPPSRGRLVPPSLRPSAALPHHFPQDKYRQKQHFAAAGDIPLPEFRDIKCEKCGAGAGKAFGYPFMLKSKT